MDDAYGYEDLLDEERNAQIITNGDYLAVQQQGQPRYIYRRVPPDTALHPFVSKREHNGDLYGLAWIEDDE
ncbi:hypothetical protein [Candidatus Viridilinea mediisalina]|uniref:Uncharacterized protein n=1 Tax=Candidatus Viridilinea mediisalina TaxID=2024553 RepID=A0A2A6RPM5_9CHLR|nr:hypothetical protein [Candidatus Viridilinea mediisalina]PDW04883.1 hypothetical protein CJ255_01370 [Candidatus Viridilinea mediisalina]